MTVAKLVYAMNVSLDGRTEAPDGDIRWGAPDAEVFEYLNELESEYGTLLFGRRMYETMLYWEDVELEGQSPEEEAFTAFWRATDKVVFSRTLTEPRSARTRIEPSFEPNAVHQLKASAERPLSIAGPELAGQALAAGLVDEVHLTVAPLVLGGGTRALPDGVAARLELMNLHRFASGVVHLRYAVGT